MDISWKANDKINKLHKRALRIVYNTVTSFENLLIKDKISDRNK